MYLLYKTVAKHKSLIPICIFILPTTDTTHTILPNKSGFDPDNTELNDKPRRYNHVDCDIHPELTK